ncbi:MAG TPA: MATE family efflux transporter [Spirochaetaceae bacterium]|nr:MATE family efflux transporter [Spirochaetaceae bacterium]
MSEEIAIDLTEDDGNILGTEKIGRLLQKFSIPGIIALLVNALYNIVDQIFIGRGVGYLGNGATNVVFPLTTFALAFTLMIGDGSASFMSLMLGKKKSETAARGAACGLVFSIAAGLIISVSYLLFLEPLCRLFGATDSILPFALEYGRIISLGIPFFAICTAYAGIIRADGSPKYNMFGLLSGCALNVILDPVFIFVFKWGVAGAAWATIIGQFANAAINLRYAFRMKTVKIGKEELRSGFCELLTVFKLGFSSFINQMVIVVVMAVQHNLLRSYGVSSEYGADIPLSALGIAMKICGILISIIIGLSTGAQPIWGYNYGARKYERVKKTYAIVVFIALTVMSAALVVFQLFPLAIISIFGNQNAMYNDFASKTLRIFLMMIPFFGFQVSTSIFFQAVGRPLQAAIASLSRQVFFAIPAAFILTSRIGVLGVLWSGPVADVLGFTLTAALLLFSWRRIFSVRSCAGDAVDSQKISDSYQHADQHN